MSDFKGNQWLKTLLFSAAPMVLKSKWNLVLSKITRRKPEGLYYNNLAYFDPPCMFVRSSVFE